VGPAAPIGHAPAFPERYNKEMFSISRPQFITAQADPLLSLEDDADTVKKLRKLALTPLKPTGQSEGSSIGFFEQGLLSGAAVIIGVILPAAGYGAWILGRKCFEVAVRYRK
jgi:hypothetical protein